ncbi:MAG: hypothetical protein ACREOQ_17800 [Gemmatimonadales bacterium]
MRLHTGFWDWLFGKKVTIELPGPGGVRRVKASERWLAQMEREGRMARAEGEHVTVHVLDPARGYHTTVWKIGEDISSEKAAEFIDQATQALYLLRVYREGSPESFLLRKDVWDDTKRKFDQV